MLKDELRQWAHDNAGIAIRVHRGVLGSWYGPDGIEPTDAAHEVCSAAGEACEALQRVYHALAAMEADDE